MNKELKLFIENGRSDLPFQIPAHNWKRELHSGQPYVHNHNGHPTRHPHRAAQGLPILNNHNRFPVFLFWHQCQVPERKINIKLSLVQGHVQDVSIYTEPMGLLITLLIIIFCSFLFQI